MKLILNKHQLYYYLCLGKSQVTQKSTDQPGWCRLCEVGNLQVWCFFGCHRIGRHCSPSGRGRDRAGADAGSSASTHQCSVNCPHPTQPRTSSQPSRQHKRGSRLSEPGAYFHSTYKYNAVLAQLEYHRVS